jgi:hypothetical protein
MLHCSRGKNKNIALELVMKNPMNHKWNIMSIALADYQAFYAENITSSCRPI